MNQACLAYKGNACQQWSVQEYDLTQQSIQDELNSLDFICKIGGHRYKVCMQNNEPGFCHVTYECQRFLGICTSSQQEISFIPLAPYQRLLDSDVKCFSQAQYSWDEIQ